MSAAFCRAWRRISRMLALEDSIHFFCYHPKSVTCLVASNIIRHYSFTNQTACSLRVVGLRSQSQTQVARVFRVWDCGAKLWKVEAPDDAESHPAEETEREAPPPPPEVSKRFIMWAWELGNITCFCKDGRGRGGRQEAITAGIYTYIYI